jgi:D-arginine dehydrogenase
MYDCIVIGAGMAGASAAFELSASVRVLLLEAEAQPGHHSTGRSAALFTPHYGVEVVRKINAIGAAFLRAPPAGFADRPLLSPRGMLTLSCKRDDPTLEAVLAASTRTDPVRLIPAEEAIRMAPLLTSDHFVSAAFEPGVMDIDVDLLLQAYLRGARARGAQIVSNGRVCNLGHDPQGWTVVTGVAEYRGRIVVNAAGAWADEIGSLAGAARIGLVPMRRTAIVVDGPPRLDLRAMPAIETSGEEAYLKPEGARIMASLGDETPVEPYDARPEEIDVALTADWLERHSTIKVRRIQNSWAGLRSFVADRAPVLGFDAEAPDFLWLAGQGGYGIMMAPAIASAAASLVSSTRLGEAFDHHGITGPMLSPHRDSLNMKG